MRTHTFMLDEGNWTAEGQFIDASGTELRCTGESRISRDPESGALTNESVMRVHRPVVEEYENRYDIPAFSKGDRDISWYSSNPAIGGFVGSFTIVGDTIISLATSEDGSHVSSEIFRMTSASVYEAKGIYRKLGQFVSAWDVVLRRA